MAVITLTIPDAQLPRVIAAVTARGRYQTTLPNGSPNPQTPAQFTREQVVEFLKHAVREHEAEQAKVSNDISVSAA